MNFKRGVKDSCAERGSGSKVSISENGGIFFFAPLQEAQKRRRRRRCKQTFESAYVSHFI